MKKAKVKLTKIAMKKHIGSEPSEGTNLKGSLAELSRIYYYYSYFNNRQDSFNFLLKYMKENNVNKYKELKKLSHLDIMTTDGWIARLLTLDCILPEEVVDRFNKRIQILLEKTKNCVVETEIPKTEEKEVLTSVKELLSTTIISEIDDVEDEFFVNFKSDFNIKNYLISNNVAQATIKMLYDRYNERHMQILNKERCKQLSECYSCYTPAEKKAIAKFYEDIAKSCEIVLNNKKRTRKIRTKSSKTNSQLVKNLNFKERDPKTGIETIKAENIIKKDILVLYDTIKRKVTIYTGDGFSVSGKTLKNYDPEKSFTKTMRKPELDLHNIAKSNKRTVQKNFDSLTTKSLPVSGRMNDNQIIVFVA